MADLVNITNFKSEYTENLLTPFCSFDDDFSWNTVTGGSNAVVSNSTTRKFEGLRALRVDFTGTSEIVFNSGGTEMNFIAPKDGIYTMSARFLKELVDVTSDINVSLYLFKNGISSLDYDLTANLYQSSGFIDGVWNCYAQSINLLAGDVISFNFKANSDSIGAHFYIDGLKLEYNDRQLLAMPAIYTRPEGTYVTNAKEYTGTWDYANTLTAQSFTGTSIYLNNNGLGTNTNKDYRLTAIPDIFDTINNSFDFSDLELGDRVDIRLDVTITTSSANQSCDINLELGIGSTPYEISFLDREFKTATSHTFTVDGWFYLGNTLTKDFPAKLKFFSDANATILVNGWAVNVIKRK